MSNLLTSTNHTHINNNNKLTLNKFLKTIINNYHSMHPEIVITYHWHGTLPTPEIITNQSLHQTIMNLLNNTADTSPEQIDIEEQ